MFHLTDEQKEKLVKLEEELNNKKNYELKSKDRRMAVSQRTGIPYDLVDVDVVRIGLMLGLIKNISQRENNNGESKEGSILEMLLNGFDGEKESSEKYKIPSYFMLSRDRITEMEKIERQKNIIKIECNKYFGFINHVINFEIGVIQQYLSFNVPEPSVESFTTTVRENMESVYDILMDEDEKGDIDEIKNMMQQLKILRNSLLGFISICEYKNIVSIHVKELLRIYPYEIVNSYLSFVDQYLVLFPITTSSTEDINKVKNAIIIRHYTKDPELKTFDFDLLVKECCTPALIFLEINQILEYCIVGPFMNNQIVFVNDNYYVMKCIIDGVRLWVIDNKLEILSERLRMSMARYIDKLDEKLPKYKNVIFQSNKTIVENNKKFQLMIADIIRKKSPLVPTEYDVFNEIFINHK